MIRPSWNSPWIDMSTVEPNGPQQSFKGSDFLPDFDWPAGSAHRRIIPLDRPHRVFDAVATGIGRIIEDAHAAAHLQHRRVEVIDLARAAVMLVIGRDEAPLR